MRLRRRIATLLVASLSLSTSAIALSNPTPVGAVLPGVIDVAVTIEAKPAVVSPPGELALYDVTASNAGIIAVSAATVTVSLPSGSFYDDGLSAAACTGSATTVTCPVGALAPGASTVFGVVASTPTSAGIFTTTATIEENDPLIEPLEYKANNTDAADVDVRAQSGAGAFGLVRGGDSLSLDVGDGRKYRMEVPPSSPGVIVSIRPDDGTAKVCTLPDGSVAPCGKGFLTEFVDHPYFKAQDPANPLFTTKTFGRLQPCRGIGNDCTTIAFAKNAFEPVLTDMPDCASSGQAVPSPCLDDKYKINGTTWFDVLMLSNDPLELPPLKLGS